MPAHAAYSAFAIEGGNYVQAFDSTTLTPTSFFIPAGPPQGLAYGNGNLYLTYGTTIERDALNGNVLASQMLPAGFDLTSVAVTPSLVFAIEGTNYVQAFDANSLAPQYFFIPSAAPQGLAYGNDALYVTHGTTIERDALNGNVLASQTLPTGFDLTSIAVTQSVVFAIEGGNYIQAFDASTLAPLYFFIPAGAPQGLTYANGNLYVTYGTTIERDALNGNVLASQTQGAGLNLAGVAVETIPEPASLLLLGGGVASLLFFRRRTV